MKQPCYLGLEDARQVLGGMGVNLTLRQMQRAAEQDAQGRRKLPFFVDPIEHKLKIEKDDLLSAYFKTASGSAEKPAAELEWNDSKPCIYARFYCIIRYGRHKKKNRQ